MKMKTILALLICGVVTMSVPMDALAASEVQKEESTENVDKVAYDFKTFNWGDSQKKVEEVEGEPFLEDDMTAQDAHYVAYKTTVAGKDAVLAYYFCNEGLFCTRYILSEEHSNENLFIDDYEDIREALTKKYDEPDYDFENWSDNGKKSYYADRKGTALEYGYLDYLTAWQLERTYISMEMSADNYNISTTIDFRSNDIDAGEVDYSDDF